MRERDRILSNLEGVYRNAYESAEEEDDSERMARLDFDFQRDQLFLEAILDVRDLLSRGDDLDEEKGESLLDKAKALRNLTRRR